MQAIIYRNQKENGYVKKVITLLFGPSFIVVLMLAAGGIYFLPENFMGVYMYADVWLAAVVVLMIAFLIAYKMRPRYTYNDLITFGYSEYEARKLIFISGGEFSI